MRCSADRGRVPLLALALVTLAGAAATPAAAAAPADHHCIGGGEARAAGDDGGPPTLTTALRRRPLMLEVSLDGLDGSQLPMSIDAVCDVPKTLRSAAAQLAGTDAVAVVSARTTVVAGGTALDAPAALGPLGDADSATVRGRLEPPSAWRKDEDGQAVPTFAAARIVVTD
jgi:hypothetical protein